MNTVTDPHLVAHDDPLVIAGHAYRSRLLVGTGKYKDFAQTRDAIDASGAEIVTVAIRRTNIGQNPNEPSLLDHLPLSQFTLLPNTAGCTTPKTRSDAQVARELLDGHKLVKLGVLGDPHTLFPNVRGRSARRDPDQDGFDVMVYTSDDPIIARELEAIGCIAIMPLASLIGSGMGILNPWNLQLIIGEARSLCWSTPGSAPHPMPRSRWSQLRRRADEHRDRTGAGSGDDGGRNEEGRRGGARGVPCRPHAAEVLRGEPQFADHRPHRLTRRGRRRRCCACAPSPRYPVGY